MEKIRKKKSGRQIQWNPEGKGLRLHKEIKMTTLQNVEVDIDEGIAALISIMWDRNFDTQFCCEGYDWDHPEDGDEHSWSAMQYRAYILMPWTPRIFGLVINLQQNFYRFSGEVPVSWDIEFHTTKHFGGMNRICLRFPKVDIPAFARFVAEQY